jgi:hypothetical protein
VDTRLLRGTDPDRAEGKLKGAARHWATAGPRAAPESETGSADAFNVAVEGWEREDHQSFGVWPENWPAIEAFMLVRTQWRFGPAGATGLDYTAVIQTLRLRRVARREAIFEDLQVMEAEIIAAWAKRSRERNR